jgi:hypothetical protein
MTRVAKKGVPVIIVHLISRDEHSPVAGDTVPVECQAQTASAS